jgi:CHAT domain
MRDQFELSILDSGDSTRAIAVARSGFDVAIESFSGLSLQPLADFHTRLADTAGGRALVRPSASELVGFGRDLFNLIVRGDVRRIYDRLPTSHIRLQIFSNRPDLQAIPWEYIQEPNSVPGPNAHRSVVRVVPTIGVDAPQPKKFNKTVRMLFVYAEPPRERSVDWAFIKSTVESEFNKKLPRNFVFDVVEGATRVSFTDAFRGHQYDILHIVCHGEISPSGICHLVFQDLRGKSRELISAADLGMFLRDKGLRVVVLSACNTSAGDFAKEFAIIATTLVESGIPAVVANQFEIKTSAAAIFAQDFYSELLDSGDLDRATTKGRMLLNFQGETRNNEARIDWGIPTLYRHLGAAKAFEP